MNSQAAQAEVDALLKQHGSIISCTKCLKTPDNGKPIIRSDGKSNNHQRYKCVKCKGSFGIKGLKDLILNQIPGQKDTPSDQRRTPSPAPIVTGKRARSASSPSAISYTETTPEFPNTQIALNQHQVTAMNMIGSMENNQSNEKHLRVTESMKDDSADWATSRITMLEIKLFEVTNELARLNNTQNGIIGTIESQAVDIQDLKKHQQTGQETMLTILNVVNAIKSSQDHKSMPDNRTTPTSISLENTTLPQDTRASYAKVAQLGSRNIPVTKKAKGIHPKDMTAEELEFIKVSARSERKITYETNRKPEGQPRLVYVSGFGLSLSVSTLKQKLFSLHFLLTKILNIRRIGKSTFEFLVTEGYSEQFVKRFQDFGHHYTVLESYDPKKSPRLGDSPAAQRETTERFVRTTIKTIINTERATVRDFYESYLKSMGTDVEELSKKIKQELLDQKNQHQLEEETSTKINRTPSEEVTVEQKLQPKVLQKDAHQLIDPPSADCLMNDAPSFEINTSNKEKVTMKPSVNSLEDSLKFILDLASENISHEEIPVILSETVLHEQVQQVKQALELDEETATVQLLDSMYQSTETMRNLTRQSEMILIALDQDVNTDDLPLFTPISDDRVIDFLAWSSCQDIYSPEFYSAINDFVPGNLTALTSRLERIRCALEPLDESERSNLVKHLNDQSLTLCH